MSNEGADITYFSPEGAFNLRVGAIILNEDKALLVNNGIHYYSIGGRVKLHETLEQAVVRETFEETGESYKAERLLWIVENFFKLKGGEHDGKRVHELGFYFLMKHRPEIKIFDNIRMKDNAKEWLEWLPFERLKGCVLYPGVFKTGLFRLPESPVHIVNTE